MALAGACLIFVAQPLLAQAPEPDVRRDATVAAVEKVMPAVVNIATETIVNVHDPFDDLLRRFFDPYHRHQAPNSQLSLGSGVIIDEEGCSPTITSSAGPTKSGSRSTETKRRMRQN